MRGRLTHPEPWRYLIGLGSNMPVQGIGGPRQVIAAALAALETEGLRVEAVSPVIDSAPLGPSRRRYANAASIVATGLAPPELLALLQIIERAFGRRRQGSKWRPRPLDLDIVLWSGGAWVSKTLVVPHPAFHTRAFVLGPGTAIARGWRDPVSGIAVRHLHARLTRNRPLLRCAKWSGP